MTITTAGTAVHLTPTVTKTFFKHYYKKAKRSLKGRSRSSKDASDPSNRLNATDEFMFDEAFHVVKAFIDLGTSDTVEAIQNFTDAPAPPIPWATTLPVMIPMDSCDEAAKLIIEHLGPQDLAKLVGGEKWWQLRPLPGLQGEWIAMSNDWKKMKTMEKRYKDQQQETGKAKNSSDKKQRRRINKRHERALSEIRAMRQKTESRLKRRSQSFKRSSQQTRRRDDNAAAEASATDDAASTTASEDAIPQPLFDSADVVSDNDAQDHSSEREELDRLHRVMLYFHGGGYYFGSLATHRYQIVRYARKFGGKCFAPIYRKAPQYPWPCALQDAVASYLYLLYPPKGAKHKAVDPKKLVVAGDSAGGGLTLALLTVIRDMGLPAPAGAVLVSPWCDLTHSFPSILQNTATDIIPPYGFIHKPSTLWPINATRPVKEEGGDGKAKKDGEDEPRRKVPVGVDEDGKKAKDDAEPAARKSFDGGILQSSRSEADRVQKTTTPSEVPGKGIPRAPDLLWSDPITINRSDAFKEAIELREQIQLYATNDQLTHPLCSAVLSGSLGGLPPLYILAGDAEVLRDEIVYLAHRAAHPHRYPLRKDLLDHSTRNRQNADKYDSQPTKVHLQIYDQMCHVLTAFAFTSQSRFAYRGVASFVKHVTGAPTNIKNPFPEVAQGGGDGEKGREEWEAGDGQGSAEEDDDGVSDNLGGEVKSPPLASSLRSSQKSVNERETNGGGAVAITPSASGQGQGHGSALGGLTPLTTSGSDQTDAKLKPIDTDVKNCSTGSNGGLSSATPLRDEPEPLSATRSPADTIATTTSASAADSIQTRHRSLSKVLSDTLRGHPTGRSNVSSTRPRSDTTETANEYAGQVPLLRPSFQSFMIRERVDVRGYLRPLEPETELQALQVPAEEIGRIKEGPVGRYLDGQTQWARRFAKTAKRVEKQRAKNEQIAQKMLQEAAAQGLLDLTRLQKRREGLLYQAQSNSSHDRGLTVSPADIARGAERTREKWSWLCDFSPVDLVNETPPPAAIAGRRDTDDALVLLRRSLQIRARAYGVQRKSRFWGAEDRTVRAHLMAEKEPKLDEGTSTDPSSKTDERGTSVKGEEYHHHRGLRVWNLLMVRKPGTSGNGREKHAQ